MLSSLSADRLVAGLVHAKCDVLVHVVSAVALVTLWQWLPLNVGMLLSWLGAGVTFLVLTLVLGWAIGRCLPNPRLDPAGKAVLITGCDRGFGRLLAQRLDSEGFKVFAGCLFPESDEARALERGSKSDLRVIGLDVTNDKQVADAAQDVQRHLNEHELWAVVCNAGVNLFLEFEWMKQRDVEWMFDVNVHGTTRVTRAFLPLLRRSRGRLVLVASYAGRVAPVWIVPYAMTKAAIISLADGLHRELAKWKVTVSTIEPTYYLTDINPRAEEDLLKRFADAPDSVRHAYGEEYARDRCADMVRFLDQVSRRDLSEVVDAMADAVSRSRPRRYYRCDGTLNWLLAVTTFVLPSFFADLAVSMTWTSGYAANRDGVLRRVHGPEKDKDG